MGGQACRKKHWVRPCGASPLRTSAPAFLLPQNLHESLQLPAAPIYTVAAGAGMQQRAVPAASQRVGMPLTAFMVSSRLGASRSSVAAARTLLITDVCRGGWIAGASEVHGPAGWQALIRAHRQSRWQRSLFYIS